MRKPRGKASWQRKCKGREKDAQRTSRKAGREAKGRQRGNDGGERREDGGGEGGTHHMK